MPRIDQVLAGYAEGDAISGEAKILQGIFRGWGLASDIYVDARHTSSRVQSRCRPLTDYRGAADDIVIHHYSIASPAVEAFRRSPARKVLIYHNITPDHYFRGFNDDIAAQLASARADLAALLPQTDAVWADSAFNAEELREMGCREAKVLPLLFAPAEFDLPPDPRVFNKFSVPMTNLLYVGRVAPNKRIEDLMFAFTWYHRLLNRQSRLLIVGSERSAWRYFIMLRMLASELDVSNICFECYASPEGLCAYYELADAFVTTSQHEGYCLPVVEAMHKGVPVIARRTGGIPEALGGAGVMYEDASPDELAVLIQRVLSEPALRDEVLASQRRRVAEVRDRDAGEELKALLGGLL
jgi:glycosyltransferase involved in cell wall biosynthesis